MGQNSQGCYCRTALQLCTQKKYWEHQMGAVGAAVQLHVGCCGQDCCWAAMVSGWEKRQGCIQPQNVTKMRSFAHSASRNGCEVRGPQLHLVPALSGGVLAHALPSEDPPAARRGVLRQRDRPGRVGGTDHNMQGFFPV